MPLKVTGKREYNFRHSQFRDLGKNGLLVLKINNLTKAKQKHLNDNKISQQVAESGDEGKMSSKTILELK